MPTPLWFDPAHFAGEKVLQMNAIKYLGRTDWDVESYENVLQNWRDQDGNPLSPGTIEDKAYVNFLACNSTNYDPSVSRSNINVSPNEFFNVGVYLENLASYANETKMDGAPGNMWTPESMLMHLYNDLHISAWQHYTNVGMYAGINPSDNFDNDAYLKARATAMNNREVNGEVIGWEGRDNWSVAEVKAIMQQKAINPIMDYYNEGATVFNLTPVTPSVEDRPELPEDWNPWVTQPPYNPYDNVERTVEMTVEHSNYTSENGVNTRFESVWNNDGDNATINTTDTIHAGANAYNTLAMELNASWPGFRGEIGANVSNIGRVELSHGETNVATPYTFDARNISNLERVDLEDNGIGSISLKNLPSSIKLVTLNNLIPNTNNITESTSLEYAPGAVSGANDSLEIGVTNVGTNVAPAPIAVTGIENLTVNSYALDSVLNLHAATGVKNLILTGGGNLKITNVANGITNYNASEATGNINMAASDLKSDTPVTGGSADTTLTLTQDFNGTPTQWKNIDQLAINPLVTAKINATNVHGISSLWVNTDKDVALESLPTTSLFSVHQDYDGSNAKITVNGNIQNLNFSTSSYAAAENGKAAPKFSTNAQNDITINSDGQGTLSGDFALTNAAGNVTLNVQENAAFGQGIITAAQAKNFTANINGNLAHGAKFNVVDQVTNSDQTLNINLSNGVVQPNENTLGKIILDSDGATALNFTSQGNAGIIAEGSSLNALRDFNLNLDGSDLTFDCQNLVLPVLRNLSINADGSQVLMGDIGSTALHNTLQIDVTNAASLALGKIQTGTNANVIANVNTDGSIVLNNISTNTNSTQLSAQGDIHLDFTTTENVGTSNNSNISLQGADIFIDFGEVQGNAFVSGNAALYAAESINYTGAQGSDAIAVAKVGIKGPSNFDLGDGADRLVIGSQTVSTGQHVRMNVNLGDDSSADTLVINNQNTGGKLSVFVENFEENEDIITGFNASTLTTSSAQRLLSSFGISDTAVGQNQIYNFGNGNGVAYEGDFYAFNTTGNTMVMLAGISGNVNNLGGQPLPPEEAEEAIDSI